MRIKIHGGTPPISNESLCETCRHSQITRGRGLDEEIVFCGASHIRATRITFKVTSCSAYDDYRFPSYYELMQQAWILKAGTRRRAPGFVRASELRRRELADCMAAVTDPNE